MGYALHDLAVGKLFFAVVGNEELVSMRIFESLYVRYVLLVDGGQFEWEKEYAGLSQVIEFAHQLAD